MSEIFVDVSQNIPDKQIKEFRKILEDFFQIPKFQIMEFTDEYTVCKKCDAVYPNEKYRVCPHCHFVDIGVSVDDWEDWIYKQRQK